MLVELETRRDMQWLDVELIVERDIDRAADYAKEGDQKIVLAGRHAHRVVGTYQKYGAIAIADKCGRSVASVQNWAHGFEMLIDLFKHARLTGNWEVRANWREFSMTHFWTAWEKKNKYNLTDAKVTDYLKQMLDYRSQGEPWSADALAREIDAHEDKAGNTPAWSYYKTRMASLLHNAFVSVGIPADIKPLVAEILKRLESRKETA